MNAVAKLKEVSAMTPEVKKILSHYEGMNKGTAENLARILMQGKLGGTGKLVILPVDQGFEHGPARSFAKNPAAYDPHYHYQLAIDAGLSAYAAPLGFLEAGMDTFAGKIPTILKVNSSNSLTPKASAPNQAR
jgi:class I fructose-bisphosphate aldolase